MAFSGTDRLFREGGQNVMEGMETYAKNKEEKKRLADAAKAKKDARARALKDKREENANATLLEIAKRGGNPRDPDTQIDAEEYIKTGNSSKLAAKLGDMYREEVELKRDRDRAESQIKEREAEDIRSGVQFEDTIKGRDEKGKAGIADLLDINKTHRTRENYEYEDRIKGRRDRIETRRDQTHDFKKLAKQHEYAKELKGMDNAGKLAASKSKGLPESTYNKELAKRLVKETSTKMIDNNLATVDKTLNGLEAYLQTGLGKHLGTGPIAQYIAQPVLSNEAGYLKKMYNELGIQTMREWFQGMSRAIDSDTERAYFEMALPNMGTAEGNAHVMLLSSKSLGLKAKWMAEEKHRAATERNDLNYEPNPKDIETIVDAKTGEMKLINRANYAEIVSQYPNMVVLDDYVAAKYKGLKLGSPEHQHTVKKRSVKYMADAMRERKLEGIRRKGTR